MSGAGNGVCSALALSNAITNLAGIFFSNLCVPVDYSITPTCLVGIQLVSSLPEEYAFFKSCVIWGLISETRNDRVVILIQI